MKPSISRKLVHVCLLVTLFATSAGTTLIVINKWKSSPITSHPQAPTGLENIPGLQKGDAVKLPRLPTLQSETEYVDLSSVQRNYLLFAFISTECAGCSQDQPFWKALHQELHEKQVAFYIITVDTDRTKVQNFAHAFEFTELPVLFDPGRQALEAFKISFVPQYVLLTSDGHVMNRWNGIQRFDPQRSKAIGKLQGLLEQVSSAEVQD